ncbi:MAG: formate--tetrahydrofolate ligase [Clostridia bacterium]|nr:formate--tetrahydrofolate ligase [Clostridia bacterium]
MLSDIEIASAAKPEEIDKIAAKLDVPAEALIHYGRYKAKIDLSALRGAREGTDPRLILVTAVTPTPAGEGKTTVSVGLTDALARAGKRVCAALREPSLGPVFGIKGGAAGGGYAQVIPMEDLNLHFTGDMHAIGSANNLLCAMLDNHIFQGNELDIDPDRVVIRRCVDMNDRQLRHITSGQGGPKSGVERPDGYDITVATEMMAALCLSSSLSDLKTRIARMILAYDRSGRPVTAGDIKAQGAAATLLKDAVMPNLVQTLEGTPVIIHGGPFANIAHGCNSVIATKTALSLADYVVTEAGFGSDLGGEKFLDIKCRAAGLTPSCVVLVCTVRAMKYQGGAELAELKKEDLAALEKGLCNLGRHIRNMTDVYSMPVVVALNRFGTDTDAEIDAVRRYAESLGAQFAPCEVFAKGGAGGLELAEKVVAACDKPAPTLTHPYGLSDPLAVKIEKLAKKIYGAAGVEYSPEAAAELEKLTELGFAGYPVCVAKTQYSFSDDPSLKGAPEDFTLRVRQVKVSAGAGFVVALTGAIMTMPGLPKRPAAEKIDVDADGKITGLF